MHATIISVVLVLGAEQNIALFEDITPVHAGMSTTERTTILVHPMLGAPAVRTSKTPMWVGSAEDQEGGGDAEASEIRHQ